MLTDFQVLEELRKPIMKFDSIEYMIKKSNSILTNIDKSDFEVAMNQYNSYYSTFKYTQFSKWIYAKNAKNILGCTLYAFIKSGNRLNNKSFKSFYL